MTSTMQREISRNVPKRIRFPNTENTAPLFTAFGCVLMERDTGKSYVYTAVNLLTGNREVISRRQVPLTTSGVEAMAERIRQSSVAGAGWMQADRSLLEPLSISDGFEKLEHIFREVLPVAGFNIREEQIELARHMLTVLSRRTISLAEAGVGIGKTLAYLVASIIMKRGRLGGLYNMSLYTGTPYAEIGDMPIVIATSSIALQKALATDYIPVLSDILIENGIILDPLTFVIRKGREHYVCQRRLQAHALYEKDENMLKILYDMMEPGAMIDLAEIDGLTPHVKRMIGLANTCPDTCAHRNDCPYWSFREIAASPAIDIQICNHNYILADALRRAEDKRPLIPNYQCLIIDEGHRFLQAARSMYGVEFSSRTLPEIQGGVLELKLKHELTQDVARKAASVLAAESRKLFRELAANAGKEEVDEETERFTAEIDESASQHLRNIRAISDRLIELLDSEPLAGKGAELKTRIISELKQAREQAAVLAPDGEHISWLEMGKHESRLCAIPKDLDRRLFNDLWSKGVPIIITSGTLSVNGDFSRMKDTLGLRYAKSRLTHIRKASPFDYKNKFLLYISENIPFPDPRDKKYLAAITKEIEQLVHASKGRAAVLFTSYNVMGQVYAALQKRKLPFPMFRMDKGGIREIERFKQSGNGILFASGNMWEGIDIPGDALSLIIVVKLPFSVPDPISEYERSQYNSMDEYRDAVIIPDAFMRSLQASGRVLRIEDDTGAAAFLDCRVAEHGRYRKPFIRSQPECEVTSSLSRFEDHYIRLKSPEYHM